MWRWSGWCLLCIVCLVLIRPMGADKNCAKELENVKKHVSMLKDGTKLIEQQLQACKNSNGNEPNNSEKQVLIVQKQLDASIAESNELKQEIKSLNQQLEKAENDQQLIKDLKAEIQSFEIKLKSSEEENKELQTKNDKLTDLGRALRSKLEASIEDNQELEDIKNALTSEKAITKRLQDLLEGKENQNELGKIKLQQQNVQLIDELTNRVRNLTNELISEKALRTADNVDVEEQNKILREKVKGHSIVMLQLNTKIASLEEELNVTADANNKELILCNEMLDEKSVKLQALSADAEDKAQTYEDNLKAKDLELHSCQESLKAAKDNAEEVSRQLEQLDKTAQQEKQHVEVLSKREKLANEEAHKLQRLYLKYKSKVDDPALFDYVVKKAEWLKQPQMDGVTGAVNKTYSYLGPQIDNTQIALIEFQAMVHASSQGLSNMVGKPEYSPFVSGLLTYGILLIPFGISVCMLVRLKNALSLGKAVMWMTLYNAVFCGILFGMSYAVHEEPLTALRAHNEQLHEFLEIGMAIYYVFFLVGILFVTIRQIILNHCSVTMRHVTLVALPFGLASHYYAKVWKPSMLDLEPEINIKLWLVYALLYGFEFALLTMFAPASSPPPSNKSQQLASDLESGAVAPSKKPRKSKKKHKHGSTVEKAREQSTPTTIQIDFIDEDEVRQELSSKPASARKKSKASSRRKSEESEDADLEFQKLD